MTRLALYRKYRSATLDDVIGQDHVVQTLDNAIRKGNISHAYLFCGPHGVGKTSVARIIARMVNQLPPETEVSSELDIIEIDAASNRGIDEIRNLRDKITTAPTRLDYKVYIIDEVHMLTREAFNALLKTLEEPPDHAIFILATTEVHKLPETVISRTQRFDFRPINLDDLIGRLTSVAKSESIEIAPDAMEVIARRSRGGFRDAISLLDQLSGLEAAIDLETINKILGISSIDQLDNLLKSIARGETKPALKLIFQLIDQGSEPITLTHELLEHARQTLLAKASQDNKTDQYTFINETMLVLLIENLTKALVDFKITHHYSLPLELAVYKTSSSSGQTTVAQSPILQARPIEAGQGKSSRPTPEKPASQSNQVQDSNNESLCLKGLSIIKQRNNSLYAVMRSASPVLQKEKLIMTCRFSFHKERMEETRNRELIESVMSKVAGRKITMVCKTRARSEAKDEAVNADDELVSSALEILGGEVV